MTVQDLRNKVEQYRGMREESYEVLKQSEKELQVMQRKIELLEKAREVVRIVGIKTQEKLQYHISDIVSLALESVYEDPYKLLVRFVQKRNKSECELLFSRNGSEIDDPLNESGGGVINIASFALRVASWTMQTPRSNNVLILDEPFGNVSADLLPKASEMLKEISKKLNLQIIMVTHSQELIESADRVFHIRKHNNISVVE